MTCHWTLIACLSTSVVAGCATSPLDVGGTPDLGPPPVPLIHRPVAPTCPTDRPAINCSAPGSPQSMCGKDADCGAGINGRCAALGRLGCACSYDTCKTDADCAANQLCDCRHHWPAGPGGPNACIASNCRVDADCGPHGYCSPSLDSSCGALFGVTGWFCHTAHDECVNDGECNGRVDGGFAPPFCGYRPEVGHWACGGTQCAG